jgi:deazaflavin-dependent oxidoreductase (nitroreductase family)
MLETNNRASETLRQGFKVFNRFMLLQWRLGLGQWLNIWPEGFGRILVITHTGRKTGIRRRTPVNYALVEGDIYCTAGFGQGSDWYRNIIKNPKVEVWLPEGWWSGTVEEVSDIPERLLLMRQVLIASGFAARLAGINPHKISDAELDKATQDYRLVRIRREAPCTGPGGPGELAWIWPLATWILLPLALRRRGKGK